jgi:hypothetical protein
MYLTYHFLKRKNAFYNYLIFGRKKYLLIQRCHYQEKSLYFALISSLVCFSKQFSPQVLGENFQK